jgi:hypothetical protein
LINKAQILDYAETFDAWRIVPRVVLFAYGGWLAYVVDRLLNWYMDLPIIGQTAQASGFCFGAITAVTSIGGYVYRIYSNSGRDWSTAASIRTTAISETVTK